MRFSSFLFLPTIIVPRFCFANVIGRQALAKESTNGEVYLAAVVATLSSYTISTHLSLKPTLGRDPSFATSSNTTCGLTSQTSRGSLRDAGVTESTIPAVVEAHTASISIVSSSRATSNKFPVSSGVIKSLHTSQGSQTTSSQTSSAIRTEVSLANTTLTHTPILATPSATSESFSATSALAWSRGSVNAQLLQSTSSNSKSYAARVSTSSYSAAVLGNGPSTTKSNPSSEPSSVASSSHTLAVVTSVSGPNGDITTIRKELGSSQVPSHAAAAASTTAASESKDSFVTTTSAKGTTTSVVNLSSGFTGTKTSGGSWPAIISFCSLSDGVPKVAVGYVTTLADGKSSITNTSPSQSLISASAGTGCAGEVIVSSDDLTTTIQLSTLPSATPFSQDEAEVVTESGTDIQYSPETLSGYNNAQPIKISTSFVEVIDGRTTTQGGWWLIGAYGHIEMPKNRPWNTGKGIGCIGGPAICNMPCGVVDVGLDLFVLIDHDDCTPGKIGPPGYPGGAVLSIGSIPDPPYPQDVEGSDDGEKTGDPERKTATNKEESTTAFQDSTITSRPRSMASSSALSSASQISSSSSSAIEYMVVAAVGADQINIQKVLREFDSEKGGSYEPDVGDTSVSGGTWVGYELSSHQAEQLSSRSDILAVVTCATVPMFGPGSSPSATPQIVDATVSLVTLSPPSSATVPASIIPKQRRGAISPRSSSGGLRDHVQTKTKAGNGLQKRDVGTRLVRQKRTLNTYPEDLSVLAWAPGVPSIAGVDYLFEETKGENTWVYLVDTGIAYRHWVCIRGFDYGFKAILSCCYQEFQNNWNVAQGYGKTNIDEDWIFGPGVLKVKADWHSLSHGTCMASRICGKRSGVAKQTTIIPVVILPSQESFLSGLQQILADIPGRREKGQCLPGKTVVTMSINMQFHDPKYITLLSDAINGIMNLGIVVVCSAGNDGKNSDYNDWEASTYPAALARTKLPWLFRIGAVDNKGVLPDWTQQGDVYAPGVDALCANKDGLTLEEQSDGSSGATASIAGLIVYEMGKESCPFGFSGKEEDYPNYQRITKQYYTNGPGAYVRPGGVWRVPWNGLDGRANTICPLTVQKRDGEDEGNDTCAQSSFASSSTTVQTSTSTFSTITSSKSALGISAANLVGGQIASLAAAVASSSSAAAAASSSVSAAAAASASLAAVARASSSSMLAAADSLSISLAAVAAASASSAQAAAGARSPFPTTTPPPSPIHIGPPLMCTLVYVSLLLSATQLAFLTNSFSFPKNLSC